ncbi:MAG TPA: glycosyl hydrolase, partial [Steroidobacteraceae bacterium]
IYGVTLGLQHIGLPRFLGGSLTSAELQASDDGIHFRKLADIPTDRGGLAQDPGQTTLALAPTTARFFRVLLSTPSGGAGTPGIDLSALGLAPVPPPSEYRVSRFMLHTCAVVNHFEDKAAFAATPNLYAAPTPPAPADVVIAPGDVLDLTDHMSADGRLDWSPPPGRWVVLRMGYSLTGAKNSPASPEATGLEVDKLDRNAVRTYLDQYLAQYQSASGGLLGARGVGFVVTDSWEAGAQNWTPALFDEFKRRRGYDLHAWLPVLTGQVVQSAAASERFLWDFRETLGELLAQNHYGQLADSLRERGMGLYSESHENGRAFIGDGMQVKRHATVPMGAMWTQKPGLDAELFGYNADVRESASVAHLYGQNLVAAESFTAGSGAWAWSPETLKPTADKEMAMGVNRFVIHTSVHQPLIGKPPGLALGPFGQWFTRNETWAEQAAPWIRYLARSSYLLQQGRFVADVAYFYGEDSNVTALFAGKAPPVPAGYNFDFINADTVLTALRVDHGALTAPSGMQYRVLALDANAQHMSLPVLKRLAEFVADGAIIIGARPADTPSLADDAREFAELAAQVWGEGSGRHSFGKGETLSGETLDVALAELGIAPDIEYRKRDSDSALLFVHRALADGDLYYIDSRNSRAQRVEVSFRVSGKAPELWHADSGEREAVSYRIVDGRTLVPLDLGPYETVFVVFRRAGSAAGLSLPLRAESALANVTGPWQLRFQEGRGAPTGAIPISTLVSWSDSADPGIKYFSGTATYTTTFKADAGWFARGASLWLDLGDIKNLADVTLNGHSLGILWKTPFRVDITDALKRGNNLLQIKVTNLWVNRLIGDQQPNAAQKITFTTQVFYKADAPLLSSGMLGPVRIVQRR